MGEAVAALAQWLRDGSLRPPAYGCMPLAEAAQAHRLLGAGGVKGRVLLVAG